MLRSSAIGRMAVIGIASVLLFGTPASAQTPPSSSTPGVVEGDLERAAVTTPAEKTEYARSALAEMNESGKAVMRLLESARREADAAERVQCLANRLTTLRALYEVSKTANAKMGEFLGANEADLAEHEFRKIAVGLSRSRQAVYEAERCGRPVDLAEGQVDIVVEGGEGGDGDDLIGDYIDVDIALEDVSPFE